MAVFIALGRILEDSVIGNIFSFIEDSSVVVNCGTNFTDIAHLDDVEYLTGMHPGHLRRYNVGLTRWLYDGSIEYAHRD